MDQMIEGVRRFFGLKIPSVWEGEFNYGGPLPEFEEDKVLLRQEIEGYYPIIEIIIIQVYNNFLIKNFSNKILP